MRYDKLVDKLNSIFKKLNAKMLSGRNTDIEVYDPNNPSICIYLEMEAVGGDRWDRIKSKYPTVRWSLAKKEKYSKTDKPIVMVSVRKDDLSDIFAIEYSLWVKEGHLEKERHVTAGGKRYVYRKGGEEPFWAISKDKVHWGYEGLEEYLISIMKKSSKLNR